MEMITVEGVYDYLMYVGTQSIRLCCNPNHRYHHRLPYYFTIAPPDPQELCVTIIHSLYICHTHTTSSEMLSHRLETHTQQHRGSDEIRRALYLSTYMSRLTYMSLISLFIRCQGGSCFASPIGCTTCSWGAASW